MGMSGLLTWGLVGFLLGIVVCIGVPILVGPTLPARFRQSLASVYWSWSMVALDRALLIRRINSGYSLVSSSYDAEKNAEKVTLGGEDRHFRDPASMMSRLSKRPFGIAFEQADVIVDPMVCEIGEHDERQGETHGNDVDLVLEKNEEPITCARACVNIPEVTSLVDPAKWLALVTGSSSPGDGAVAEEFVRKSQLGYTTRDLIGGGAILMSWVAGFGVTAFALDQLGGGGGGGGPTVNVPMTVALDVVGVLL